MRQDRDYRRIQILTVEVLLNGKSMLLRLAADGHADRFDPLAAALVATR